MELKNLLMLASGLFSIGILGVLTRRNAIGILMSLEIMLNAINIMLVSFSRYYGTATGQVFALFAIAITVAEVAIGLAIVILLFRLKKVINADEINLLRW